MLEALETLLDHALLLLDHAHLCNGKILDLDVNALLCKMLRLVCKDYIVNASSGPVSLEKLVEEI